MTVRLALPALLLLALPAAAQERFELSDPAGKKAVSGSLCLDGAALGIDAVVDGKALRLGGRLEARETAWTGTLTPVLGIAGVIDPARTKERWSATLRRDGPLVALKLTRGLRKLELEGLARLGAPHADHEALIRRFYEAFVRGDGDAMAACYAPDARFSDPVFPDLRGEAPGDMWRMLCAGKPQVTFRGIRADARYAVAHWEADYELFGNKIHNVIEARFELREGKIVRHVDQFDFRAWSRQAFGPLVRALPSVAVRHVVRKISAGRLASFQEERAAAQKE